MDTLFFKRLKSSIFAAVTLFLMLLILIPAVFAQDRSTSILEYIEQVRLTRGVPAISAAVAVDGKIVFSGGVGYADVENHVPATGKTVYRIASISKPVSAIGMMQLLEQGKVNLNDEIQKYIPSFPVKQKPIRLTHLLTHTSGIRHYNPGEFGLMEHFETLEDAIRIFKDDPLKYEPGTDYSYSTYGFNLIQGVIETASKMDIHTYMKRFVFEPAGMLNTVFELPGDIIYNRAKGYGRNERGLLRNAPYTDVSIKYVGGGIISTVEDLVKVFIALDSGVLMKPETVALMYKDYYPQRQNGGRAIGWSWNIDNKGRKRITHSGGATGFRSMLINYPAQKVIVAVITNQDFFSPGGLANTIVQGFLPPVNK